MSESSVWRPWWWACRDDQDDNDSTTPPPPTPERTRLQNRPPPLLVRTKNPVWTVDSSLPPTAVLQRTSSTEQLLRIYNGNISLEPARCVCACECECECVCVFVCCFGSVDSSSEHCTHCTIILSLGGTVEDFFFPKLLVCYFYVNLEFLHPTKPQQRKRVLFKERKNLPEPPVGAETWHILQEMMSTAQNSEVDRK